MQIQSLKEATGEVKILRAMALGWQAVLETLNATVLRFNKDYFVQADSPHHQMRVIAAKQTVIASLRALPQSLDSWYNKLKLVEALSETTIDFHNHLLPTLDRIRQFKDVRNCAFHFGDPLVDPDNLIAAYEYVQGFDLDDLNKLLRVLFDFGLRMQRDALLAAERLEKQEQQGA